MDILRISGIILGLGGIILSYTRYHLRRLRKIDFLFACFLSIILILLGLFPNILNSILELFSFEKGGGGRLIGLLFFSSLLLFLLFFYSLSRIHHLERLLDRLIRELAKKTFREKTDLKTTPLYVIIPAYNEAENIMNVLNEIPKEVCGLAVKTIVVVDGATDATADVVKSSDANPVCLIINRGGGSALKAGYELAIEDQAQIVVTLDADGQHAPEEIPNLIRPIIDDEADLVNGSRMLGVYERDSRIRSAGVIFFSGLVSLLTMTRVSDCSNSFRAIRVKLLSQLDLHQTQFHTTELLIEAIKHGARFKEVPITIKKRISGKSKKPASLKYAWGFSKAIITTWLR